MPGTLTVDESPDPGPRVPEQAAQELASVHRKLESARALLVRLLQELVVAERQMGHNAVPPIVEANEQLMVTALRHQAEAEAAARALKAAALRAGLDALTQLPNRALLRDRFAHAIAGARRRGSRAALLFLDLDRFNPINDELGHGLGDEVLKWVAQRLVSVVREADTVSRYGGDEFVILLSDVAQPSDVELIAAKLLAAVATPCHVAGHALQLSASIGISMFPDDGEDVDRLIRQADDAMYRAKRRGTGGFAFHAEAAAGAEHRRRPAPVPIPHDASPAEHERRFADLREANERLLLATLSAQELQAAAERAQQRQAAFLDLLAKELANPLAPIRLAAAMLGRAHSDGAVLQRVQSIIEQQAGHMSHLVAAMNGATHAAAGSLELEREPLDMLAVVGAAIEGCRPMWQARQQHFSAELPSTPVGLEGDKARLAQVVSNLLDNASKYTPDGGELRLLLELQGQTVVLTVSDNGIGITAQALPDIFDPFMPDAQALGFNGVGRGIGLTVVRALVEAHGGTVVARSDGGGLGSRFVVTLPLRQDVPAAAAAAARGGPDG